MQQPEALLDSDAVKAYYQPGSTWAAEAGERIRRVRTDLGWSLDRLAALTGSSGGTLSRIESGSLVPRLPLMSTIAYALTREVTDLWPIPSRRRIGEIAA